MLAVPTIDLSLDDDELVAPQTKGRLYRAASVGNSWGVTSIGRGFNWGSKSKDDDPVDDRKAEEDIQWGNSFDTPYPGPRVFGRLITNGSPKGNNPGLNGTTQSDSRIHSPVFTAEPSSMSPVAQSPAEQGFSNRRSRPSSPQLTLDVAAGSRPSPSRSPTMPRPRRRSSQQRVSLIAGRLSMVSIDPPSPPPPTSPALSRYNSHSSFTSVQSAPPPPSEKDSFLGGRSISEFVIEGDIGRGAYGLVKRAREMNEDGTLGPPIIIKQIIKSRILADCWKKHPKYGTIPIEIYVMSAISSTSYILPPRRPWDPARFIPASDNSDDAWVEGEAVKGHPNICPLLDFFEDNHYYYLVMPSTTPTKTAKDVKPPSDLFDLVEGYPQGLPAHLIRSYLGQIADALCFLHSKGIVHRDIKDENVVLGATPGKCILIDFGSSGIVKKHGWDTFSGTLDYAAPEILAGERYHGKEQDVWAFGVVAFVLLVGECPFNTAAEAQEGLQSPFANASIALDERCGEGKELEGEEIDGGGALGDAAVLVRACLGITLDSRPTFDKILKSRFLVGNGGWGMSDA
ncbi:kinase-like protein [Rickenella mellea]|uniref:Kinase-like protein n=1 Tax=Rickenella mellea TaxID=50990 RepID=A0A4Y7QLI5_9AGAM|nr:kinase-like protein [Rickenella mellea]